MRMRLAFITTTATLTRGQSERRQLILTTGEVCRTSPDALWPHLHVLLIHRQTISCYYVVNETKVVSFDYKPRGSELATQVGQGHLIVQMRLAYGKDELLLETRSLPHDH